MAIITFLSDFGESDHYVSAVKAKILSANSGINIVDISHKISTCDIAHAAYVTKAVFHDFPKGTIHIIAVNSIGQIGDKYIAAELDGHYFITTDNGLLGLISDQEPREQVELTLEDTTTTFPAKQVFAPAAAKLASGSKLKSLGTPLSRIKRMLGRHLKANKRQISGNIIRVDHYGNLITNIDKTTFDILSKDKKFTIHFSRETVNRVNNSLNQVDAGDVFSIFNDQGLLEIGINQGIASELLGLEYDSPVIINFEE
ncbi:SAM hydrolase/SAM-dependent halogenase family protein [Fulvivirga sediminis]|uniref:SAM-dependent chlorinase/fluorinase n=1 Tax=Fulvivirga sediminis TaxID=2803949 RepID=A0A937FA60_9BACT|nr:SAM-dependent chlorinase/fluorinase [Fulvivirga sediminis]MBL3658520.1 SAM-dependent chlorinase/fluorinase [Fulvivirga sediminis]